jgi:hypothetical protein
MGVNVSVLCVCVCVCTCVCVQAHSYVCDLSHNIFPSLLKITLHLEAHWDNISNSHTSSSVSIILPLNYSMAIYNDAHGKSIMKQFL